MYTGNMYEFTQLLTRLSGHNFCVSCITRDDGPRCTFKRMMCFYPCYKKRYYRRKINLCNKVRSRKNSRAKSTQYSGCIAMYIYSSVCHAHEQRSRKMYAAGVLLIGKPVLPLDCGCPLDPQAMRFMLLKIRITQAEYR